MDKVDNSPLDFIPSRIKYYLLDWKDRHLDEFRNKYGDVRLRDLTKEQLHAFFHYATTYDSALILRLN